MKKRESRKGESQELAEYAEQVGEKIRKRDGRDLDDCLKAESEVTGRG